MRRWCIIVVVCQNWQLHFLRAAFCNLFTITSWFLASCPATMRYSCMCVSDLRRLKKSPVRCCVFTLQRAMLKHSCFLLWCFCWQLSAKFFLLASCFVLCSLKDFFLCFDMLLFVISCFMFNNVSRCVRNSSRSIFTSMASNRWTTKMSVKAWVHIKEPLEWSKLLIHSPPLWCTSYPRCSSEA